MALPPRSRTVVLCALLVVAIDAGACARRYAASLAVTAPRHEIDETPIASSKTPTPPVATAPKPAARVAKPSPAPRTRPAPRAAATADADAIGTAGEDVVAPQLPAPTPAVVTVTNTPDAQTPDTSSALATIIVSTLRRPAAAVPIGAGFAASAFASVVIYRRRHRLPN